MASLQITSLPYTITKMSFPHQKKSSYLAMRSFKPKVHSPTQHKAICKVYNNSQTITPRPTFFQPSIWTYDYIQSLTSEYKEDYFKEQVRVLREDVRSFLCKVENELDQLEFIDVLQRLGVDYHFHNEIRNILDIVYKTDISNEEKNLYAIALKFRLLRQYGYIISSDVFIPFKNEKGNFEKGEYVDVEGMLSLYEASFHSFEDEAILDEAKDFTSQLMKEYLKESKGNYTSLLISHALELPLHWRTPRWETQWFINVYERNPNMIPDLLQLAKLDFNIAHSIYIEELKDSSRWWKEVDFEEKLSFARDRLVEAYVFSVGMNSRPDHEYYRKNMAKVNSLITVVDDVYDLYGNLEELKLFTEGIDRWDLNAMDSLPDYMKIYFHELYDFVNEIASQNQKKNGYNITPYLVKVWTDTCKSKLIEAEWYHSGYKPSLEEYLEISWITVGGPVLLINSYFLIPHSIKNEELYNLEIYLDIIRLSSMLLRLANDLGSSKRENEMGDIPTSIECYMNESGASEAEAREHIKSVMNRIWKKMNEAIHNSCFSECFISTAVNTARVGLFMYQFGDGYSIQDHEIKGLIESLIIQPIPLTQRNI